MSVEYLPEILLYEIVDLFPNLILALLPFQNTLRFTKKKTVFFIILLYIFVVMSRATALKNLTAATILSVIWIILYLTFYIVSIKAQITKLLFVLLTILNYGSLTAIVFSHIAYHCFSYAACRPYSFYSTAILALVIAVTFPVIYQLMNKKFRTLIMSSENNRYWKYLWLVPATFCLSYYYNLFANGGIIAFSSSLNNVLFAVFFNLGALFVTYLVMHLLEESNLNLELKTENYHLNMQTLQYENLQSRIEEARRAKHDLRQNLAVIQSCLRNGDQEGLKNYMQSYTLTLPADSRISYCNNYAVNALIVYYADIAAQHHIRWDIEVDYPSDCVITDTDAVVLFGNLIENAIEACIRQTEGETFISLHVKPINNMLVITLDNSYCNPIQKDDFAFISSKSNRKGIGTASITKIAGKYNGTAQFHYTDNIFYSSVILSLLSAPANQ